VGGWAGAGGTPRSFFFLLLFFPLLPSLLPLLLLFLFFFFLTFASLRLSIVVSQLADRFPLFHLTSDKIIRAVKAVRRSVYAAHRRGLIERARDGCKIVEAREPQLKLYR